MLGFIIELDNLLAKNMDSKRYQDKINEFEDQLIIDRAVDYDQRLLEQFWQHLKKNGPCCKKEADPDEEHNISAAEILIPKVEHNLKDHSEYTMSDFVVDLVISLTHGILKFLYQVIYYYLFFFMAILQNELMIFQ